MLPKTIGRFGVLFLALAILPGHTGAASVAARARMLPDRLLQCRIGHVVNFDPGHEQTAAELRYDSIHAFSLFLPAVPVRKHLPPETFEKPEPVNPRTRIVSDPDRIAPQPGHRFEKVVDYWPDRVELSSTITGPLLNVIVLNPINAASGTANVFMTRASELTHFDARHIYQGTCSVKIGAAAYTKA